MEITQLHIEHIALEHQLFAALRIEKALKAQTSDDSFFSTYFIG